MGFAAIYYQWQAIVIWFPRVLIYGAVARAYLFLPQSFDKALAANKIYTIAVLLGAFWFVTLIHFPWHLGLRAAEFARRPVRHHHSRRAAESCWAASMS